jgi:hypothetical protein
MTLWHGLVWRIVEQMLAGCACLDPAAMLLMVSGSEPGRTPVR